MKLVLTFVTCAVGLLVLPGVLVEQEEAFRRFRGARVVPEPTRGLVEPTGATPDCVELGVRYENSLPPTFAQDGAKTFSHLLNHETDN